MKELDNGDLIFHKSELKELTLPIPGYKQSHGNECLFRKQYELCIHRIGLKIQLQCGRIQDKEKCNNKEVVYNGQIINPKICFHCTKREMSLLSKEN